jgi:diguanylate cyclase (GGDEF)-like protein
MIPSMQLDPESGLFVSDAPGRPAHDETEGAVPLYRRVLRWLERQTASRVEDEVVGAGRGGPPVRLVLPIVSPVLLVPAALLLREPENAGAFVALVAGGFAIAYAAVADVADRRMRNPFWLQLFNSLVYAGLISAVLWAFVTLEHPRPHSHWIVFFLYFLLIGASGLSDDPRQCVGTGIFSVIGYLALLPFLDRAAMGGASPMAARLAPEFEWVANSTKVALMIGATVLASASAGRGRALRRMSLRDGLTGLLNRHAFDECLERVARRAERNHGSMTIAMIDIDHFKRLNDGHGHATGDAVLRWVASWLLRCFRTTDVVARFGGEEFVVAFLDTDDEGLRPRLETLRLGIERTRLRHLESGSDIRVTVSMGTARFPVDGDSVADVLACADERLYAAKQAGRNRIVGAPTPAGGA